MSVGAKHQPVKLPRRPSPKIERREQSGASIAERIYIELKAAIVAGTMGPGTPIDKNEIGMRFGASLSPVTMAINRLGYERLVRVEPQRGSFVAPIVVEDILQLMGLRRALEIEAACTALHRSSTKLIESLDRNLAYQAAAMQMSDIERFYELDVAFHRLIIEASGLWKFNTVLDDVRSHLDRVRFLMLPEPGRMAGTFEEHSGIRAALASRSVARVEKAMRRHLDRVEKEFHLFAKSYPTIVA
ncbi:GntR family transcriptional regulator [soil metagenome]